ncbi:MAG: cohesin domain-containing protein, partial [Candidatus Poribacteria bacterium]|nr:cohesin domain-containing protein [Candidatus Poribacteria bacterium]
MNLNSKNMLKGSINRIWLFAISMLYGLNALAGIGGISMRDMRVDQWQWFTLDINMSGEDVHHFEATLSYDPQMLVVKEVNEGNFLNPTDEKKTIWSAPAIDEKAGTIQIAGSLEKLAQPVSGWGQIARIVFEP